MSNTSSTPIQFSTKKEIAESYNISVKTLNTNLEPFLNIIGVKIGRFYTPLQISKIYECLGAPNKTFTD
jgi:hypothetical protein